MDTCEKNNAFGRGTWLLVLLCVGTVSCSDSGGGPNGEDAGTSQPEIGDIFEQDRVLDVKITIAESDWEALAQEGRNLAGTMSGCEEEHEYTYFPATVEVDGIVVENAGVRKKGFLGSLSTLRPSVKVNFGKFADGQTLDGHKRMTLNNNKQDTSNAHQVVSYGLFKKAGLPAPRCNLARVTVNGKELGVYAHVESVKKPFLAGVFGDDSGNLYEGQAADFTDELMGRFQRKTNEDQTGPDGGVDTSDLQEMVDALEVDNDELIQALEPILDLDEFYTFWAMEVVAGHWDGYSGDRNNFYVYKDPTSGLFRFIPWGTDGTFKDEHSFFPDIPKCVYALGALAHRLYNHPDGRTRYLDALRSILDEHWNEQELHAEVDRIESLVGGEGFAYGNLREFIDNRRSQIEEEIDEGAPEWPYPLYSQEPECVEPADITGSFNAVFGPNDGYITNPQIALQMEIGGVPQTFTALYNSSGYAEREDGFVNTDETLISIYAVREGENDIFAMLFSATELFSPGQVPFHGFETFGMVFEFDSSSEDIELLGYISDGHLSYTSADVQSGTQVAGSFQGLMTR